MVREREMTSPGLIPTNSGDAGSIFASRSEVQIRGRRLFLGTPHSMNMIEKILAKASGKKAVAPGEVVVAKVDLMVMHDLSSNFVMKVFENEMEAATISDPSRITFAFDHNFSAPTQQAAEALADVRRFAAKHGIETSLIRTGQRAPCDHRERSVGARPSDHRMRFAHSHLRRVGFFATGVGNNSMAALGFPHSLAWFRDSRDPSGLLPRQGAAGVSPRDMSQYTVSRVGEDGAVYKAVEYAGPYIEGLSVEDRVLFPLMSIDVGAKCGYINPDEKTIAFAKSILGNKGFRRFP